MSNHNPSKLEFLVKFFNNIFHRRKLIVFIGVNGIIMATLKWQKNNDKTTTGYRLYWRYTSEPQWQFSRYVGDVSQATLKNVVIDNYYFGVAAVNKDGIESPVVFPGDVGAFE